MVEDGAEGWSRVNVGWALKARMKNVTENLWIDVHLELRSNPKTRRRNRREVKNGHPARKEEGTKECLKTLMAKGIGFRVGLSSSSTSADSEPRERPTHSTFLPTYFLICTVRKP